MSEERRQPEGFVERGVVTDVALFTGPTIGVVAGWALGQYGPGSNGTTPQAQEPQQQVILPSGTGRE